MTELLETIAKLSSDTENKDENYCDGVKHDPLQKGKCVIDGVEGKEPTPKKLLRNMKKHKKTPKDDTPIPKIPALPVKKKIKPSDKKGLWDIEDCDANKYPFQTHHLIPKKFLPKQPVCVLLSKNYEKNSRYQLEESTRYSTDHAKNGYCLPFASTSYPWKTAAGDETAEKECTERLMELTHKQLHQGNHNKQDFDEEDEIELDGYLDATKKLLKRVFGGGAVHVRTCSVCKDEQSGGKIKLQPLDKIVDHVDMVSLILKLKINSNKIFVSQKAYNYYRSLKK